MELVFNHDDEVVMEKFLVLFTISLVFCSCQPSVSIDDTQQDGYTEDNENLGENNSAVPVEHLSPTWTLAPKPDGSPIINPIDGGVYVFVPAGEFLMGTDAQQHLEICEQFNRECHFIRENETPAHIVYLDAFWIGQYEVTNQQFSDFLNERGNQSEGGRNWLNTSIAIAYIHQSGGEWQADPGYSDHPVVGVSWYGAAAYCQWVGGQLPTEAQWEKAARGGLEGQILPWGNEVIVGQANFCDEGCTICVEECINGSVEVFSNDGFEQAAPVGSFAPNGYGLYDMAGNVSEWVADWYSFGYYSNSPYENPQGPEDGISRIIRGGTWGDSALSLRVALRGSHLPVLQFNAVGFRCVLSMKP
jgi:formylglycine-generating enzyme required for sulfatase activity